MSDNPEDCVKFGQPDGNFSVEGPVGTLLPGNTINNDTAKDIGRYHYRRSKFYQLLCNLSFDDLREVQQSDESFIWEFHITIESIPFTYIMSQREIVQSILLTPVSSNEEKQARAEEYDVDVDNTTITVDGIEYFVNMNLPLHFNMDGNPDSLLNMGMMVLGQSVLAGSIAAIAAQYGITAFGDAYGDLAAGIFAPIWTIASAVMKAGYRFSTGFINGMLSGLVVEDAIAAGMTAAGDEWGIAMAKLDTKALCFSLAGTVIMAALIVVIELVLHQSYQNVYVYNLTDHDMEFDMPYKDYGEYENLPTNKVAAAEDQTSGGFDLGQYYNGVAYDFISDSEFHGLGYTMRIKLKDKGTDNVVKTFSGLFEVPYSGDNSLYASVGEESSYKDYFTNNQGKHCVTQYTAMDSEHEMVVCFDYLSGKHENPATGNEQYLYQSLVIIRKL